MSPVHVEPHSFLDAAASMIWEFSCVTSNDSLNRVSSMPIMSHLAVAVAGCCLCGQVSLSAVERHSFCFQLLFSTVEFVSGGERLCGGMLHDVVLCAVHGEQCEYDLSR